MEPAFPFCGLAVTEIERQTSRQTDRQDTRRRDRQQGTNLKRIIVTSAAYTRLVRCSSLSHSEHVSVCGASVAGGAVRVLW